LTSSRTGPFSLIRDLLSNTDKVISISQYGRILQITLGGFVEITSPFLEKMKKSGFVLKGIHNVIDPEFRVEDLERVERGMDGDVPIFVWTIIRFKDTELPPIEHGDDYFAVDEQTKESKVNLEANSQFKAE
jgi:hypothetical protein